MAFLGEVEGQMAGRKGCHHGLLPALGGNEAKDALVDGAGHAEAETRVDAIAHVGKVLVGKQFQQHGGHSGHTCLEIGLVPHAPACPVGLVQCAYVIGNLRHHQVAQVVVEIACGTVGKSDLPLRQGAVDT